MDIKRKDGTVIMTVPGDSLEGADLRATDLWGADLRELDLRAADLWGANLREADLWGADLWGADLRGADLWEADLWGADLWGADLRGADLWEADLRAKQKIVVIQASRHTIIAIDDDVRIGGGRMPLAEWIDSFEAFGKWHQYTEAEIREYGIYLRAIAAVLEKAV